jgi:hypothetical protein
MTISKNSIQALNGVKTRPTHNSNLTCEITENIAVTTIQNFLMAWRTLLNHTRCGPKAARKHNDRRGDQNFVLRGRHSQGYKLDKRWCPRLHVFQKGVLLTYGNGNDNMLGVIKGQTSPPCLLLNAFWLTPSHLIIAGKYLLFSFDLKRISASNLNECECQRAMNLNYWVSVETPHR